MKDLKILKGAKMLSKMEQKVIKGGILPFDGTCNGVECYENDNCCVNGYCGRLYGTTCYLV